MQTPDLENINEDEVKILADQDKTSVSETEVENEVMGGTRTGDIGLDSSEFARGEIDLVEQIQRTTAAMDAATHRQ